MQDWRTTGPRYSIDFSCNMTRGGKHDLHAILGHNDRTSHPKWNIDETLSRDNVNWLNPRYREPAKQLQMAYPRMTPTEAGIYTALRDLLGASMVFDARGVLKEARYGKAVESLAVQNGEKKRRAYRLDSKIKNTAVLAVGMVVSIHPSAIFPHIREENWTQERIDQSTREDRGPLDKQAALNAIEATKAWALDRYGDQFVGLQAHLDEKGLQIHVQVIPAAVKMSDGTKYVLYDHALHHYRKPDAGGRLMLDVEPLKNGQLKALEIVDSLVAPMARIGLVRPEKNGGKIGPTYSNRSLLQAIAKGKQEVADLAEEADRHKALIALLMAAEDNHKQTESDAKKRALRADKEAAEAEAKTKQARDDYNRLIRAQDEARQCLQQLLQSAQEADFNLSDIENIQQQMAKLEQLRQKAEKERDDARVRMKKIVEFVQALEIPELNAQFTYFIHHGSLPPKRQTTGPLARGGAVTHPATAPDPEADFRTLILAAKSDRRRGNLVSPGTDVSKHTSTMLKEKNQPLKINSVEDNQDSGPTPGM